jgi:hypothetical protein
MRLAADQLYASVMLSVLMETARAAMPPGVIGHLTAQW